MRAEKYTKEGDKIDASSQTIVYKITQLKLYSNVFMPKVDNFFLNGSRCKYRRGPRVESGSVTRE